MRWHRPPSSGALAARPGPVRVLPVALVLMLGATFTPGSAGAQGTTPPPGPPAVGVGPLPLSHSAVW